MTTNPCPRPLLPRLDREQPHLGVLASAPTSFRPAHAGTVAGRGRALQCAEPGDDRLWQVLGLSR